MADIEWLVEEIDNSPEGPHIGAFFDFDGTLISGYSAAAFFTYRLKKRQISTAELMRTIRESVNVERRGHDVTELMNVGVQGQAGRDADEALKWARTVFAKEIAEMIYPDSRTLIEAHLRRHHTVVIASSATRAQVEATADELGIDHIICTEMEIDDEGRYTGALASPIRWGEGKSDAVAEFAEEHLIDLDESFGYSNGSEDLPFLETVGRPCALNPDDGLVEIAGERGWPVARLVEPRSTSPVDVVRSVAAISVFAGSVGAAAALAVLNRSRSLGANVAASVGCDLGMATAGVRLARDRRGEHLGRPSGGLPLQPPEPARRLRARVTPAQGLHRRRQEVVGARPVLRAGRDSWPMSPTSTAPTAPRPARASSRQSRPCAAASRSRSPRRAPAPPRHACCPSRRGRSTWPCRPASRWSRS